MFKEIVNTVELPIVISGGATMYWILPKQFKTVLLEWKHAVCSSTNDRTIQS
jgi:hypothetical protein